MTLTVGALSPDSFFGLKKGHSAPYFSEIFLIFRESVETITLEKYFDFNASFIDQYIKGLPPTIFIFLFLIPFEPALAGIMQIKFFLFKLDLDNLFF